MKLAVLMGALIPTVLFAEFVVPNEPTEIPGDKQFFGWNTKSDGSGIWAGHYGRCARCGSIFPLWGAENDFWGSCTNSGCVSAECANDWSVDFYAFRGVASTEYSPIFVDDGYDWQVLPSGLWLIRHADSLATDLSIDALGGRSVVGIGEFAFWCCPDLASVAIGDSVQYLYSSAFIGTELYESQLATVLLGGGFIYADDWVLQAYSDEADIVIEDGVRGVALDWYENLNGEVLESISLPASLEGKSVTLPPSEFMSREGKRFVGWNTRADGTGIWIDNHSDYDFVIVPNGGVTYYAMWIPDSWELETTESGLRLCYVGEWESASTHWTIPGSIGGVPVVALGSGDGCSLISDETILSVTIPDSVTFIGRGALEGTGAYDNERAKIVDTGVVSLDGWVMRVVGTPTDLVFPEGTRGIVSTWYDDDGEELCLDELTSVAFPSSLAGRQIELPSCAYMFREGLQFVGWNTLSDGTGSWVPAQMDSDSEELVDRFTVPEEGATYYPVFVAEDLSVIECQGLPIVIGSTVRIPQELSGETISLPDYWEGCLLPWNTGDEDLRFLGWCMSSDGKGTWLEKTYDEDAGDYVYPVTVPDGGLTVYPMTVSADLELERLADGLALCHWGSPIDDDVWTIPSEICGLPIVQIGSSKGGPVTYLCDVEEIVIPESVKTICPKAFENTLALAEERELRGENGIVILDGWVIEANGSHPNLSFEEGIRGLASGWSENLDGETWASVALPGSMAGQIVSVLGQDRMWRDGKLFVGWNTRADGTGEWMPVNQWCDLCEQVVTGALTGVTWNGNGIEYQCPHCHESLYDVIFETTVPSGGQTWYATFVDEEIAVGAYEGVRIAFDRETIVPSSLAGHTILLPDYAGSIPSSWGDGLQLIGWCTTADGTGAWLEKSDQNQYALEVPDGGITLHAMLVSAEINCEKVKDGMALYGWGSAISGNSWTVPSEICGQPVVQLGGGKGGAVIASADVQNVIVPDSVKIIYSGALPCAAIDGWLKSMEGRYTELEISEGTRGVATGWCSDLDCDVLRMITIPASMAGSSLELPVAYRGGYNFVGWNTASDGSGDWAGGLAQCTECGTWMRSELITSEEAPYWACPYCHTWQDESIEVDSRLITVPDGGATYYAIFTDVGLSFSMTEGGLVLSLADVWDRTSFDIPSEYVGEPIVGIGADCFSGCMDLKHVTIPSSVRWIGEGAFDSTGLYDSQVAAAGSQPGGMVVADDWVICCFGKWSTLALPETTRGLADGWLANGLVDGQTLREIVFPASLGGQTVKLPGSEMMLDEDGTFVGWNTASDATGEWIGTPLDDDAVGSGVEVVLPAEGVTAHAIFQKKRQDVSSGTAWLETGALAVLTAIDVTDDVFSIPAKIDGKTVVGIQPQALDDVRESSDGGIELTVPAGVEILQDAEGNTLFDAVCISQVTFAGDGVSTNEIVVGRAESWLLGWSTSSGSNDLASVAKGYCDCCACTRELTWGCTESSADPCWNCASCGTEVSDGTFVVPVPPEGATYYRICAPSEDSTRFEYEACDGGVVLTSVSSMSPNYTIPSEVDGQAVVAIGAECFAWNEWLVSVTVPESVRWIGDRAFYGCAHLRDAVISTRLRHIGSDVFQGTQIENPVIAYSANDDVVSSDWMRRGCTGFVAFLNGGTDFEDIVAGDGSTYERAYDGTAFDIEWSLGTVFRVSIVADAHGTVRGDVEGWWPDGASLSIAAAPDEGWRFERWEGSGVDAISATDPNARFSVSGPVSLRAVFAADPTAHTPPDWDGVAKDTTMLVYAVVSNRCLNMRMESEGSLLAAFAADGECRGVAEIENGPEDTKVFQLLIGVEDEEESDFILKAWDAGTGEMVELSKRIGCSDCDGDLILGSLKSPIVLAYGTFKVSMSLKKGWNWVSPALDLSAPFVSDVFAGIEFANDDMIKSAGKVATYCDGVWYPSDFALEPGEAYMVYKGTEGECAVTADGLKASSSISVKSGWNWIGTTLLSTQTVACVTHSAGFSENDILHSSAKSATFSDGIWYSSEFQLIPGVGYKAKLANAGTLTFGEMPTVGVSAAPLLCAAPQTAFAAVASQQADVSEKPTWVPVTQKDNLVAYVQISNEYLRVLFESKGSVLAAFASDGECRGTVDVGCGPKGKLYQLPIGIKSSSEGGFKLKLWDAASAAVYDVGGTIDGNKSGVVGKIQNPVVIKADVLAVDPIPEMAEPTKELIATVMTRATDEKLTAAITNETQYADFSDWASSAKSSGGSTPVGAASVMASPNAWLSYALGSETLIESVPTDADLAVESFEPSADADKTRQFDFTVSVKDIAVGRTANTEAQKESVRENLKQILGIEGGSSLEDMSSANVQIDFDTPTDDGKVKFTAGPKDAATKTFFMKVRMK